MRDLAPIVLFTYNRPQHTRCCLESLFLNKESQFSDLYIFSDGAKTDSNQAEVEAVRQVLREKQWAKNVYIIEHPSNKGLKNNIIEGVSEVINQYGKVIVLEDDLEVSEGFLQYMNDALDFYSSESRVMHISAYMYPLGILLPETFFYNVISSWGWATWARAWQALNTDVRALYELLKKRKALYHFDLNGSHTFRQHLEGNLNGKIDTWAIRWYASIYLQKGFCLSPGQSLVQNIGFDDSGTHAQLSNQYIIPKLATKIEIKKIQLTENKLVRKKMHDYYKFGGLGWQLKKQYYLNQAKAFLYKLSPNCLKRFYRQQKSRNFDF